MINGRFNRHFFKSNGPFLYTFGLGGNCLTHPHTHTHTHTRMGGLPITGQIRADSGPDSPRLRTGWLLARERWRLARVSATESCSSAFDSDLARIHATESHHRVQFVLPDERTHSRERGHRALIGRRGIGIYSGREHISTR